MRLLLDTHIVLWWFADDPLLPAAALSMISDPASDVFVSAATSWEIAIKAALGRLTFPITQISAIIREAGFTPLGIEIEHSVQAGGLPRIHDDPFDRMLIAQAQYEGMTIVTADAMIRRYPVAVLGSS